MLCVDLQVLLFQISRKNNTEEKHKNYPIMMINPVDVASATGYVASTPISRPIGKIAKAAAPENKKYIFQIFHKINNRAG